MSKIELLEAGFPDANLVAELSRKSFEETFGAVNTKENMQIFLDEQFTTKELMSEVGRPEHKHMIIYCNEVPAGYFFIKYRSHPLLLNEKALEISRIYCLKDFQGMGLGKLMMQEVFREAKRKHFDQVWLGVWKQNTSALSFYHSFGYKIFGTTFFMLGKDCQEDWLMEKKC